MYKLDKIFVRKVPGTHFNNMRMTDLRSLKLYLIIHDSTQGKGYWKINHLHLDNEEYKLGIVDVIEKFEIH